MIFTKKNKNQKIRINLEVGFCFIEILIALSIGLILMINVISMSNNFLRQVHHCYLQNLAINSLNEMIERLRANSDEKSRIQQLDSWNQENQLLLPEGNGSLSCNSQICTLTIDWQEQKNQRLTIQVLI